MTINKCDILQSLAWVRGYLDCCSEAQEEFNNFMLDSKINDLQCLIHDHHEQPGFYGMVALGHLEWIRGNLESVYHLHVSDEQKEEIEKVLSQVRNEIVEYYRECNNAEVKPVPHC